MTREKLNERAMDIEALRQGAIDMVLGMTDEECAIVLEAFKIYESDETKTVEECLELAKEKLGYKVREVLG